VVPRILHVLWSPQSGPICAYANPSLAWTHARTMLGIEVSQVALHTELPEIVHEDLESDYNGEEITPVEAVEDLSATVIAIDDIDDAPKK
jgi:hypothetical protein